MIPDQWLKQVDRLRRVFQTPGAQGAWLFSGVPQAGLEDLAYSLIADRLRVSSDEARRHPDVITITQPEETTATGRGRAISVDDIRDALERLSLTSLGETKVLVVTSADALTDQAQNALLKFVEDPAGSFIAFFVAEDGERLLPTLRSRMTSIVFPPAVDAAWTGDGEVDPALFLSGSRAERISLIHSLIKRTKEDVPMLGVWLDGLLGLARQDMRQHADLVETILSIKDGLRRNGNPALLFAQLGVY